MIDLNMHHYLKLQIFPKLISLPILVCNTNVLGLLSFTLRHSRTGAEPFIRLRPNLPRNIIEPNFLPW